MKNLAQSILLMIGVMSVGSIAFSHSKVDTTNPANGAVLAEAPASIDLTFGGKIRLTKVILQREGQAPIHLDLSGYKRFENSFSFPNPSEDIGRYTIEWRGLGADGHVMQGTFTFTVE